MRNVIATLTRSTVRLMARGVCLALLASCIGESQAPPTSSTDAASLKKFLQTYVKEFTDDERVTYFDGWVDLDGDGIREAIVYLKGSFCGSGGCTLLVLKAGDSSYGIVTKITVAWAPVRVLSHGSHGWKSLAVMVAGGGIRQSYEAELSFDGTTYPGNPTVAPAQNLTQEVQGDVLIPSSANNTDGKALHP